MVTTSTLHHPPPHPSTRPERIITMVVIPSAAEEPAVGLWQQAAQHEIKPEGAEDMRFDFFRRLSSDLIRLGDAIHDRINRGPACPGLFPPHR
jgi:hypothetical protein